MNPTLALYATQPSPAPRFLWEALFNPLDALANLARQNGDIAHVRVRNRDLFLLNHPDFIEQVLLRQQDNFVKGPALRRARILLGEGLLTSEGETHLAQRRSLQPAFHPQRVDAYVWPMTESALESMSRWRNGQRLDMAEEMMRLTLDIALQTLFGTSPAGATERVRRAMSAITRLFPLALLPFPDSARAGFPHFKRASADLNAVVDAFLADPQTAQAKYALINILRENKRQFTEEQVRSHALTFLLAGHETASILLAWCWDFLAHYPAIQTKVQAEADRVLGDSLPTPADLEKLTYTRAVVKETLRMRPPAWAIGRQAREDCEIGGAYIPAGSVMLLSQWVTHHDPRYYAEPEEFRPERWEDMPEHALPPFAFFPFGGGSRVCIGENFAWTEATLVLALAARRWRARPVSDALATPRPSVTLRPKRGVKVIVEKR
ncbi:MAG: cytochrome P450 [Chloroflexota bacterium]